MVLGLFEHFGNMKENKNNSKQQNRKEQTMKKSTQTQTQKRTKDQFMYVYGQIYRGYLDNQGETTFVIHNVRAQQFRGILNWFKKEKKYIVDFQVGNRMDNATEIRIEGFDVNNIEPKYEKYCKAVLENYIKEVA